MAITTKSNPYGKIKGIRKGMLFVHDKGSPIYLDGAQMQYAVYRKGMFGPIAYVERELYAKALADVLNSMENGEPIYFDGSQQVYGDTE